MTTVATSKFLEFKSAKSPAGHDWFYAKRTNDASSHDSAVVITTLVKQNDEYNFLFLKTLPGKEHAPIEPGLLWYLEP